MSVKGLEPIDAEPYYGNDLRRADESRGAKSGALVLLPSGPTVEMLAAGLRERLTVAERVRLAALLLAERGEN